MVRRSLRDIHFKLKIPEFPVFFTKFNNFQRVLFDKNETRDYICVGNSL